MIARHLHTLICHISDLFQVEFSDESDTEAAPLAVMEKTEKKKNASKTSRTLKPTRNAIPSDTKVVSSTVDPEPSRRTRTTKKSTALPSTGGLSSEEETRVSSQTRTLRGRPKKSTSSAATEEPERMRMIKEEEQEVLLNVSLEELRGSDTETNDTGMCM